MKRFRYDLGENDFIVVSAESRERAHDKLQKLLSDTVVQPENIIEVEE